MANNAVDLIRNLAFEVEAIPYDNVTKFKSTGTPLNVKIRVKKKEKGSSVPHGVISVSKNGRPEEALERIRLASSDQTIMSFNMLMESELAKVRNKKRKSFLGVCFGATYDEDESPYLPAQESLSLSRSESEILMNKLKHSKHEPANDNKQNSFFGKCKPGGCLDPPFGDERYKYLPANALLLDQRGLLQKPVKVKQSNKKIKHDDEVKHKNKMEDKEINEDTILNLYQSKNQVIALEDSESIITYPPEENDWQVQDKNLTHRRQSSASSSKSTRAFESVPKYYTPKKRDSTKDTNRTSLDRKPEETEKSTSKDKLSVKESKSNYLPLEDKEKLSYGRPLSEKEKINYTRPSTDKVIKSNTSNASGIAAAVSGSAAAATAVAIASARKKEKKEKSNSETSDGSLQRPQSSKVSLRSGDTDANYNADSNTDLYSKKRTGGTKEDKFIDASDSSKGIPTHDKRSSTIFKKSQFTSKDKTDIWDEEERRLSRTKNITIIDDNKEPTPRITDPHSLPDRSVLPESGNEFMQGSERKKSADKPITITKDKTLGIDAMKEHQFRYSGSRDLVVNDSASLENIVPIPTFPRDLESDKTTDSSGQLTKSKGNRIGTDEDRQTYDKDLRRQRLDNKGINVESLSQGIEKKRNDMKTDNRNREQDTKNSQSLDGKGSDFVSTGQHAKRKASYIERDENKQKYDKDSRHHILDSKGSDGESSRQGKERKEDHMETDKYVEKDAKESQSLDGKSRYINLSSQSIKKKGIFLKTYTDSINYQSLDGQGSSLDSSDQDTKTKNIYSKTDRDPIDSQSLDGKGSYIDNSSQGAKRKETYLGTEKDAIYSESFDRKASYDSSDKDAERKRSYTKTEKDRDIDAVNFQRPYGKGSYVYSSGQYIKKKSYSGTEKDRDKDDTNSQSLVRKSSYDSSDNDAKRKESYSKTDNDRDKDAVNFQRPDEKGSYIDSSSEDIKRQEIDEDSKNDAIDFQSLDSNKYVYKNSERKKVPISLDENNYDRSSFFRSPIKEVYISSDDLETSENEPLGTGPTDQIHQIENISLSSKTSILRLHAEKKKSGNSIQDNLNLGIINQAGSTELHTRGISADYLGKENVGILKRTSRSSSMISPQLSPKSSLILNLALKRTTNNKKVIVRSLDSNANHDGEYDIILLNTKLKPQGKEIRIPITDDSELAIKLKKAAAQSDRYKTKSHTNIDVKFNKGIGEKHWAVRGKQEIDVPGVSFSDRTVKSTSQNDLHKVLSSLYVHDLMPVQNVIKSLKEEVDVLAGQLTYLKKPKLSHSTKPCLCQKKNNK